MEKSNINCKLSPARVKICGLTRLDQALEIANLGVGAIGFVLVKSSKRFIPPEKVAHIAQQLPPFCKAVGVVHNQSFAELQSIYEACKLDLLQLHGEESPELCHRLSTANIRWVKAFRVGAKFDFACLEQYPSRQFLLDAWSAQFLGGSGLTLNWVALRAVCQQYKIILAGGLNAENIQPAINACSPAAIDLSSSIEKAPGDKDIQKVKQLLAKLI